MFEHHIYDFCIWINLEMGLLLPLTLCMFGTLCVFVYVWRKTICTFRRLRWGSGDYNQETDKDGRSVALDVWPGPDHGPSRPQGWKFTVGAGPWYTMLPRHRSSSQLKFFSRTLSLERRDAPEKFGENRNFYF